MHVLTYVYSYNNNYTLSYFYLRRLVAYLLHRCCTIYFWLYFVGHCVKELLSIYCLQCHSTKEFFRNGYSFHYLAGVGVLY